MHVTICHLTLHENVFYATREVGRLYETGRYLHNYALAYALKLIDSPYRNESAVPRYAEDMATLNQASIYVTPARPLRVEFEITTFKYADNRYRVKMEPGSRNTPSFGRAKELAVGSRFEFAVISAAKLPLPRWVRLGKWMSKASVQIMAEDTLTTVHTGGFRNSLPINPLDLSQQTQPLAYDIISMPPVSLLDRVELSGPHWRLANGYRLAADLAYRFPS
jgi:CRISPR-associated protein Csc1